MTGRLLSVIDLRARYGRVDVLRGVSISVAPGEIVLLIGQNGTGKSTTLKAVFGLIKPVSGQVLLDGTDITSLSTAQHVRLGVNYVPQTNNLGRGIFPTHTVRENLELGTFTRRDRVAARHGVERAFRVFPMLQERADTRAGYLSGGQQQMLAMSIPMSLEPRLLLLDEPTSGLSPAMGRSLMATVRRIRDESGIGVLLVEQNIRLALEVADRVLVMRLGEVIREVKPETLLRAASLLEFM